MAVWKLGIASRLAFLWRGFGRVCWELCLVQRRARITYHVMHSDVWGSFFAVCIEYTQKIQGIVSISLVVPSLLYRAWNTELVIQGENQVDQNASAMYFAQ